MSLNERISQIIEFSGFTSSEFADEIDVQRSSISHITSGRNKPSLDFLIKVKEKFPQLDWDWLIKGEGEMFKKAEAEKSAEPEKPKNVFPDLFAIINEDDFGMTEKEKKETLRESVIPVESKENKNSGDSQRLASEEILPPIQITENQGNKIKRIVLFYENGKFESFEP